MFQKHDLVRVTAIPETKDIPSGIIGTKGRITHVNQKDHHRLYNVRLEPNECELRSVLLMPAHCLEAISRPRIEKAIVKPLNAEIRDVRQQLKTTTKFSKRIQLHQRLSRLVAQSDGKL